MEEGDLSLDYECYICDETNEGDTVLICDQCLVHACHPSCDDRLRAGSQENAKHDFATFVVDSYSN